MKIALDKSIHAIYCDIVDNVSIFTYKRFNNTSLTFENARTHFYFEIHRNFNEAIQTQRVMRLIDIQRHRDEKHS